MKEFWEQRYSQDEYIYGTLPNEFFKKFVDENQSGKILLPAEGEGRNAVYAALNGWEVYAFDQSSAGRDKALLLAEKYAVDINYELSDVFDFYYEDNCYDYIGIFYFHIERSFRKPFFDLMAKALRPGGKVVCEVFSTFIDGEVKCGPPNIELRYEKEEIEQYFVEFNTIYSKQEDIFLKEGNYHSGEANVIRLILEKKY